MVVFILIPCKNENALDIYKTNMFQRKLANFNFNDHSEWGRGLLIALYFGISSHVD